MVKFLFLSLMINPLDIFRVDSDYGAERCISEECTCRVSMSGVNVSPIDARATQNRSIFFEEGESSISSIQASRVEDFLSQNPSLQRFTLVGYTDGCGSTNYNYSLSLERAREVSRIIRQARPSARITLRGMSELSNTHNRSHRKVEIFAGDSVSASRAFPDIVADVYLIDASGSMGSSFNEWVEAIQRSRPPGSRVYISYSPYCYDGQRVISITPGGGTEIWYSYWFVLDKMSSGQTLAIISDFDSRVPITPRERAVIEEKVRRKRVIVRAFMP